MIEKVSSQAEIENLYKEGSHAPYTPVKNGYGYYGVLLSHKETGKIHCHLCNGWFNHLGAHIAKTHKIKSSDFKRQFGFSQRQPLCSESFSGHCSDNILKSIASGKIKPIPHEIAKTISRKNGKRKSKKHTLLFLNKNSICPEQVKQRVMALGEKLGHYPSSEEMKVHEPTLFSLIVRRYKKWNTWKSQQGLPVIKKKTTTRGTKILALHKFLESSSNHTRENYAKYAKLNKLVSYSALRREFGSWNRCLHAAGLNVKG